LSNSDFPHPFGMPPISPANQRKLVELNWRYLVMQFVSERLFTALAVTVQMFLWLYAFQLEIKSWWWFVGWYVLFDMLSIFRQWWFFRIQLGHQQECMSYLPFPMSMPPPMTLDADEDANTRG